MKIVFGTRNNYQYKILVTENLRKGFTCNCGCHCMDNIKNNVKETVDKTVSQICLGQETDLWWALVDTFMNFLDT